jgi:hypothetical protein
MIVYRIEDDQHMGPYYRPNGSYEEIHGAVDYGRHPPASEDSIKVLHGYLFGFETIDQLRAWFNQGELRRLYNMGFYAVSYKTSEIHKGGKQCAFRGTFLAILPWSQLVSGNVKQCIST